MLNANKVILALSCLCFAAGIALSVPFPFESQREGHAAALSASQEPLSSAGPAAREGEALATQAVPVEAIAKEAESLATQLENLFSSVAQEIKPTVVAIVASKAAMKGKNDTGPAATQPAPTRDFGSGFLIDPRGYILTNHHLVKDAGSIEVSLADGRNTPGKIVRSDFTHDIALVKIEFENLPVARLGDSGNVKVGQWILAIGHPFGLLQTVTTGIVGALGRSDLRLLGYENFIQTDAAISPGSSGGPLVNLRGEVVGINTAKMSDSGVSFAVPINLARALAERWIAGGNISRMGISTLRVDRDMADYYRLAEPRGAFISYVEEKSAAAVGGLLPMDLVVEFGGREVRNQHDLHLMITEQVPHEPVLVGVVRRREAAGQLEQDWLRCLRQVFPGRSVLPGGVDPTGSAWERKTFRIVPDEKATPVTATPQREEREDGPSMLFGFEATSLTPELANISRVPPSKKGVAIIGVDPGSDAWRKGLRKGAVILGVNSSKVENIRQLDKAVKSAGNVIMLRTISRGYDEKFLFIRRTIID